MEDLRGGSKPTGKWDEEEEATSTSSSFSKSKTSTTSSSSKSKARWADEDASSVCSDNYQSVHLALPVQQQQATKAKDLEEDDTESEDTLNLMKVHLKWFLASRLSLYSICTISMTGSGKDENQSSTRQYRGQVCIKMVNYGHKFLVQDDQGQPLSSSSFNARSVASERGGSRQRRDTSETKAYWRRCDCGNDKLFALTALAEE